MKYPKIHSVLVICKKELVTDLSGHRPYPHKIFRNSYLVEHIKTLNQVTCVLSEFKIPFQVITRASFNRPRRADLVITVGGDGTFLHASHHLLSPQLLMGVNSNPSVSHGAFCYANRHSFRQAWIELLEHRAPLWPLYRMQVTIQKKKIRPPALNDMLFANPSPAGTSRYLIKLGKSREPQKSSGVWVSTAAGSTAAIRSAGGDLLPKDSKLIQFRIREPFIQNGRELQLKTGIVEPHQKLVLISKMTEAMIFIDGSHLSHPIRFGERVEIQGGKTPVWAVLTGQPL